MRILGKQRQRRARSASRTREEERRGHFYRVFPLARDSRFVLSSPKYAKKLRLFCRLATKNLKIPTCQKLPSKSPKLFDRCISTATKNLRVAQFFPARVQTPLEVNIQNLSGLAKKSFANGKLSTINKTKMTKKFSKTCEKFIPTNASLLLQGKTYGFRACRTSTEYFPCFRRCLLSQPEKCAVLRLKF